MSQARGLVRLEHVDPRGRQEPQHRQDQCQGSGPEGGEVRPARTRDEEHRREGDRVDHRRADVGLDEHEEDRAGREADRLEHDAALAEALGPVGQEAGEKEDEQQLPELGRLEAEEAEIEPALRVARDRSRQEHEQHQTGRAAVDRALEAAVVIGVDQDGEHQADEPHGRVDALADDVVAGVCREVVARDPGDRPEPVADERSDRAQEDPVESPEESRDLETLGLDGPKPLGACVNGLDHPPTWPCSLKNCWKTFSAAGAAASAPKPPFSISAQTVI